MHGTRVVGIETSEPIENRLAAKVCKVVCAIPNTGFPGKSRPPTPEEVAKAVTKIAPGAYALGHLNNKRFCVEYVGRSDFDVGDRLTDHIGQYERFKFDYCSSAKVAFERECHLWHDFGGPKGDPDNDIHPARPNGSSWACPRCHS